MIEDSDAIRLLNQYTVTKSEEVSKAIFAQRANFKDTSNRIMFSIETSMESWLAGLIFIRKMRKMVLLVLV